VVLNTINSQVFLFWDFIFKFGSYIVFCVVLLCVFTFCVPCCVLWCLLRVPHGGDVQFVFIYFINVREHWRGNQQLTIQRNWVHKTKKKQNKNTTQYVLDTTLQLFVGGSFSWLGCLCFFAYSGVQHILCCVFVLFFLRLVYPVSLDCQLLIAPDNVSRLPSQWSFL
jgi:hypothetical protein